MEFPEPPETVETISPATLKRQIDAGEAVTIVDTRKPDAFEAWHIGGESVEAINVPYPVFTDGDIDPAVRNRIPSDRSLIAVCAIGKSSAFVAGVLADRGYDVVHLEDGMEGWARLYEAVEVRSYDGRGRLWQYQRPSSGCLGYLLVSDGLAAVIDPLRAFADRYVADAQERGATLEYALDTHVHADHVSGVRTLADRGVEAVLPAGARDRGLTDPETFTFARDGTQLQVGVVEVETIHTPGHTSEMCAFAVDDAVLVTGDTLFLESVGRPDLEAGSAGAQAAARDLYRSLQEEILPRPDSTVICPGHHSEGIAPSDDGTYTATLGAVTERLELLGLTESQFADRVAENIPPRPANFETIIAINLEQQMADDEEAFELELGPNNCAATAEH